MTRSEVMGDFMKKTVVPVAVALLLFSIFSRIFVENGSPDYFLIWLACGVPFGLSLIHISGDSPSIFHLKMSCTTGAATGSITNWFLFSGDLRYPKTTREPTNCPFRRFASRFDLTLMEMSRQ